MRLASIFTTLGLLISVAPPASAFDLTPRTKEILVGDGGVIHRTYFQDGDARYTIYLDSETELTGDSGKATFQFKNLDGASFYLTQSPLTPKTPFSTQGLAEYREAATAFAPLGAIEITEESETDAPYKINDWDSYRFAFTYKLPGESIKQSVTFLNLTPKHQLILVVTSFGHQFNPAEARAAAIMYSWRAVTNVELSAPGIN